MTLETLYNFLNNIGAELVVALGGLVIKKLCAKKTTPSQHHTETPRSSRSHDQRES